jgi:hypothetical protein
LKIGILKMKIELSDADHDCLTTLIYTILDAFSARQVDRMEAMSAFAHVITAGAIGNERELRGWLKPDTVARWISSCDGWRCPFCRKNPCVLVEHFGIEPRSAR